MALGQPAQRLAEQERVPVLEPAQIPQGLAQALTALGMLTTKRTAILILVQVLCSFRGYLARNEEGERIEIRSV